MVMCSSRPFSTGRFRVKPAPKGVTSMSRVTSLQSISDVSRQRTRTGSFSSSRSRMRFHFRGSDISSFGGLSTADPVRIPTDIQLLRIATILKVGTWSKLLILLGFGGLFSLPKSCCSGYNNTYFSRPFEPLNARHLVAGIPRRKRSHIRQS